MSRLNPAKLHVQFAPGTTPQGPVVPRCYTLTHSDATGDLYLTVGADHDREQIAGWYTRLMRDEVLADWQVEDEEAALHVHCHVSGGLVAGPAGWRYAIFRQELPLVLEAFRFGDQALFAAHPTLDQSPVWVHFHATQAQYNHVESWGTLADYRLVVPGNDSSQGEDRPL
ncbi:MAG: staygreen family protein [Chloroflexi bacterium]|nr:staygreen family protein [Chloroflexota bacterium]MBU1751556.1 staygreen family protein [Chloroflexota bacterium]